MKLYRYFYLNTDIFANITDWEFNDPVDYYNYLNNNGLLSRSYGMEYIQRRLKTEQEMFDSFIKKGGSPQKRHPYYLTLGNCDNWFYKRKHCFGSIMFDIGEFDLSTLSFTYGDSIPTYMDRYNDGKEYRKNIYSYEEIKHLIKAYGYPQEWNPYCEKGPENYIEVQVWSDAPIIQYRPSVINTDGDKRLFVSKIASRIMRANNINTTKQEGYDFYILKGKQSLYWHWFCSELKKVNDYDFHLDIVHGIAHAYKCSLMAFIVSSLANLNEKKTKTLVLAALYHDIGRKYYEHGKTHGRIGSEKVETYISNIQEVEIKELKDAICFHDEMKVDSYTDILTWLRDVDTLDYIRLGVGNYNMGMLKTVEGNSLIRFAIELNIFMFLDEKLILKLINEG